MLRGHEGDVPPQGLHGAFDMEGRLLGCRRLSGGLIHDTYLCTYGGTLNPARYVVQRVNTQVFRAPDELMQNLQRVSAHLRAKLAAAGEGHLSRRVPTVVPARSGEPYWVDQQGNRWRSFAYIENARTYDTAVSVAVAERAAGAYGAFVRLMSDLPPPPLHETICGFHDTPKRFRELQMAIQADNEDRASGARSDIDFALEREQGARALADLEGRGVLVKRVTHNDTKLSNVLFDRETDAPLCVIDLDTVMPGLVLHDFGDLVRSVGIRPVKAHGESSLPGLDPDVFEALVRGYLAGAEGVMTRFETTLMPVAARVIALELGVRFLTDYLQGDTYFRTGRSGQNLERARRQFQLVTDLENKQAAMEAIVANQCRAAGDSGLEFAD